MRGVRQILTGLIVTAVVRVAAFIGSNLCGCMLLIVLGQTLCDLQTLLPTFFLFPGEYYKVFFIIYWIKVLHL